MRFTSFHIFTMLLLTGHTCFADSAVNCLQDHILSLQNPEVTISDVSVLPIKNKKPGVYSVRFKAVNKNEEKIVTALALMSGCDVKELTPTNVIYLKRKGVSKHISKVLQSKILPDYAQDEGG